MTRESGPLFGKSIAGPVSARMKVDGRSYLNFYGSGYLALGGQQPVVGAAPGFFNRHGFSALDAIPRLETRAAALLGTEASICLASGYLIGLVGLAALAGRFDLILLDELAHYSLVDASTLSAVPVHRFAHADADALDQALRKHVPAGARPLVVTDGVFAATGRVPPLADYAALVASYDGRMFVDEAHGAGVLGATGRGAAEHAGVYDAHLGMTFSKAYCAHGAAIGCSKQAAEQLRHDPRVAAMLGVPSLSAIAAEASLDHADAHPEWRARLGTLGAYLRAALEGVGIDPEPSPAPIVAFRLDSAAEMKRIQARLFEDGIFVLHASGYVGCSEQGLLRCSIFRDHDEADIDRLAEALRRA